MVNHPATRQALGADLAEESRRLGSWTRAAAWLADALNAIDGGAGPYMALGLKQRVDRDALISEHVESVEGDHHDVDQIRLPDGTRVCWHPGRTRRSTRWIVEGAAEQCSFLSH